MSAATPAASAEIPATLVAALRGLDERGVRWSLLRPRAALAAAEGDVDVLVEAGGLDRVRELLGELGFVEQPVRGPDLHALAYDEPAGRFLWVHAQTELLIAGEALPAGAVLAAAQGDGLPQPSDPWLLWILLLRALVDKGELPERHRPEVAKLARRWTGGPAALEELARRRGVDVQRAVAAAAASDWDGLQAQSVYRPPEPRSALRRLAGVPRLARELVSGDRRGLGVAIIGPDGAGKTTLVEALGRALPWTTRIQYMGLTGGKLHRVDSLRVPGLILAGHLVVLWSRYLRSRLRTARGEVVLFERYTLDGAVPSGVRLGPAGRLSRWIQRWSCPMPDLVLLLDASGETLYGRSGAYSTDVLADWRQAFARLAGRVSVLERLDAERPADQVQREAQSLIWRRYAELHGVRRRS